jgi:UDP-galactopyranose mutase
MKYDYLIVGAGLYGSVFANKANSLGKKCLVIDKRSHIAGNCYTEKIENINVHKYGPHIFHTSSKIIWDYVNSFVNFNQFTYQPVARYKEEQYTLPFNMWTFYQLWGVKTPVEAMRKIEETRLKIENPKNLEEWALTKVGKDVYEKLIYGYTKKQWMREPKDLPSFIIKRLPLRFNYDLNYFNDKYVGIPEGGYTHLFEKLLNGIDYELKVDYFKNLEYFNNIAKKTIFTGKIDEYFNYQHGELEYRTLDFKHEFIDSENLQGCPVINYTSHDVPYTRTIEHKHFERSKSDKTVITHETPAVWHRKKIPYYPVNDRKNNDIFKKYKNDSEKIKNLIFGGRLGSYKYYDMHQVIGASLSKVKEEINGNS